MDITGCNVQAHGTDREQLKHNYIPGNHQVAGKNNMTEAGNRLHLPSNEMTQDVKVTSFRTVVDSQRKS
jgi:hypothetical protein